jgi:hypothetical protein
MKHSNRKSLFVKVYTYVYKHFSWTVWEELFWGMLIASTMQSTLYSCSEFGQSLAAVAAFRFEIQKYTRKFIQTGKNVYIRAIICD